MVVDIGLVAAVVGTAATVRVVAQQIRLSRRDRLHTELMRAELERTGQVGTAGTALQGLVAAEHPEPGATEPAVPTRPPSSSATVPAPRPSR